MWISLIGFGEVGAALADDLTAREVHVTAWDIAFADDSSRPSRAVRTRHVERATSATHAVERAHVIISAVTAAQTVAAAEACVTAIPPGAFFLDLNSASARAKADAARAINHAGGRYVEAAVMSAIHPKRLAVPMLLGGPHVASFVPLAQQIGFTATTPFSETYGVAAAAKLSRSIIVKGMEALLAESLLTARHYGVEATVLDSLADFFPGLDWPRLARYMISRAIEHGARRAEEMREAARTVEQAGLEPLVSEAIAARQEWAAARVSTAGCDDLADLLDVMLESRDTSASGAAASSRPR